MICCQRFGRSKGEGGRGAEAAGVEGEVQEGGHGGMSDLQGDVVLNNSIAMLRHYK